MFARLYVEALLSDPERADLVWIMWYSGMIEDEVAAWAWCILALRDSGSSIEAGEKD